MLLSGFEHLIRTGSETQKCAGMSRQARIECASRLSTLFWLMLRLFRRLPCRTTSGL